MLFWQSPFSRQDDPPYANYQAQQAPAETIGHDQEDYYAQIRKKPTAARTQSLSTEATEDPQLFVHVAPPKPERYVMGQYDNGSHQLPPDLPQRYE